MRSIIKTILFVMIFLAIASLVFADNNVYITPNPAFVGNTLTCNVNSNNAESFKWYENGYLTVYTGNTFPGTNVRKGDIIKCEAYIHTYIPGQGMVPVLIGSDQITVSNTPPVLATIGNKQVNEGELLTFQISATDADEDTLSYSASGSLKDFFNPATKTFSWQVDYDTVQHPQRQGTFQITFIVSDGSATDSETITITVNDVNREPSIELLNSNSPVNEGENLVIGISATDADGDSLQITSNIGDVTKINGEWVVVVPTDYDTVQHLNGQRQKNLDVTVTANDNFGGSATVSGSFIVNDVNRLPEFNLSEINITEEESKPFDLLNYTSDADNDTVTFEVANFDSSKVVCEIVNGNILNVSGAANFSGTASCSLNINDGYNVTTAEITINVENVNDPPVINNINILGNLTEGKVINFSSDVFDVDNTVDELYFVWNFSDGTVNEGYNLVNVSHTFQQNRTYQVNLTVSDGEYNASYAINVDINDSVPENLDFNCIVDNNNLLIVCTASVDAYDTPLTYLWSFGDGTNETRIDDNTVSHQYSEVKEYNVTLTVTDADGSQANVSKLINVGGAVYNVSITADKTSDSALVGDTVNYILTVTNLGNVVDNYTLNFILNDNNIYSLNQTTITNLAAGSSVNITLNATSTNSSGEFNATVIVVSETDNSVNDSVHVSTTFEEISQIGNSTTLINSPKNNSQFNVLDTFLVNATIFANNGDLISCNATLSFSNSNVLTTTDPLTQNIGNVVNNTSADVIWNVTANAEGSSDITVYTNCSQGGDSSDTVMNITVISAIDTTPPSVIINEPQNRTYNVNVTLINVTATDPSGISNVLAEINNGSVWNVTLVNVSGYYINNTINLGDGSYTIRIYANDTLGYMNDSETVSFVVNTSITNTPPQIQLDQPLNNTQFNDSQDINFNFTVIDDQSTNLVCSIYLDGILNQTNNSVQNNTLTNFLIIGVSYGSHNWYINCTDGELNNVSEIRYFNMVDTIPPQLQFVDPTPLNGSSLNQQYIEVNVTASDSGVGLDTITVYLYNSTGLIQSNTSTTSPFFVNFTNLPYGTYYINVTANDTAGNVNKTETRTINLAAPLQTGYVIINEFDINPDAGFGNEWIELFNPSNNSVNLTGWYILDAASNNIDIPDVIINPQEYVTFYLPSPLLNNGGENLTLYDPFDVEIDNVDYMLSESTNTTNCWARVPNAIDTNTSSDWRFQQCSFNTSNNLENNPPTFIFNNPQNNSIVYGNNININITFLDDTELKECYYMIDNNVPVEVTCNETNFNFNTTVNLVVGEHNLTLNATDIYLNNNIATIVFNVSLLGNVTGTVRETDGTTIMNANVKLIKNNQIVNETLTDVNGNYILSAEEGNYTLEVSRHGYVINTTNVTISAGQETIQDVVLIKYESYLTGIVKDTNNTIFNATVQLKQNGQIMYSTHTNASGGYSFASVTPGTYNLTVIKSGFDIYVNETNLIIGNNEINVTLIPSNNSVKMYGWVFNMSNNESISIQLNIIDDDTNEIVQIVNSNTNPDINYVVNGLPAGNYRIESPGYTLYYIIPNPLMSGQEVQVDIGVS